ncbi:MAG: hypothetical protein ABL904_26715 [Hyphomicrobiaceae bacterium]
MSNIATDPIDDICNRGTVRDSDVLILRRIVYARDGIAAGDIEALFRINDMARIQDAGWPAFFIEAVTDFLINELQPQGYVTANNASWLINRIGHDGRIDSATELELLLNVLDQARWVPESLVRFALDQVKFAVIHGDGPLRASKHLKAGRIAADEVALLRRILYAFGGDGNAAITRIEAEVLFDIEDATAGSQQAPEWQDLFVKGIASVVMAASGYKVPSREEALRQENWLATRGELSISDFLGRVFASYDQQSAEERALARLERQRIEIITNEEVSESEATWLAERIARDGTMTPNERMVLSFLKRESRQIHPTLQTLIDRVAA